MSLTDRVIHGVKWQVASQIASALLQVGALIVLSRLLDRADFGAVAAAMIVREAATILTHYSLNMVLVQRSDLSREYLCTAFWTCLAMSAVVAALLITFAHSYASLFARWEVAWIVRALVAGYLLRSLACVHKAVLERDLRFDRIARAELGNVIVYALTAGGLAWHGWGFKGLAVGIVAGEACEALIVAAAARWRPEPVFSRGLFRSLLGRLVRVCGFNVLQFGAARADRFVVGTIAGLGPLGLYDMGRKILRMPVDKIMRLTRQVALPAFSAVQTEAARMRAGYLTMVRCLALASFPVLTGLLVLARPLVLGLFGGKWEMSVLPLQLLVPAGLAISVGSGAGSLLWAQGRARLLLGTGAFRFLLIASFVVAGTLAWGINGAAAAISASALINFCVVQHFVNRTIGLRPGAVPASLLPATAAAFGMALGLLAAERAGAAAGLPAWIDLPARAALGAALYWMLLRMLFPASLDLMREIVKRARRGERRPD